ncbi:MAG: VOC family protein [Myxococcota bacterium]|nr:VOC family protein [Myxococcota bacterium]
MAVKPIPDNYPRLCPIFTAKDSVKAIDFYTRVLGAKERFRMSNPDGTVAHCELTFGDSLVMFGEPYEPTPTPVPQARLSLYVEDCDQVFKRAVAAGAVAKSEPKTQFYGDRMAKVLDPFGIEWSLVTHVEDVSEEEMNKRMAALGGG